MLLLIVLLFQPLQISGCTKNDQTIGDGKTQGTCDDPSHYCMPTGQCLGN